MSFLLLITAFIKAFVSNSLIHTFVCIYLVATCYFIFYCLFLQFIESLLIFKTFNFFCFSVRISLIYTTQYSYIVRCTNFFVIIHIPIFIILHLVVQFLNILSSLPYSQFLSKFAIF